MYKTTEKMFIEIQICNKIYIWQIFNFRDPRIFVLIKLIGTIFVANVAAFMV